MLFRACIKFMSADRLAKQIYFVLCHRTSSSSGYHVIICGRSQVHVNVRIYIGKYNRTVWYGWMIVNSKECALNVRVLSTYMYGESEKNTRNLNHIVRWPCRDSKRAHPNYKPEVLMLRPPSSGIRLKCWPIERLSWLRFGDVSQATDEYYRLGCERL